MKKSEKNHQKTLPKFNKNKEL